MYGQSMSRYGNQGKLLFISGFSNHEAFQIRIGEMKTY